MSARSNVCRRIAEDQAMLMSTTISRRTASRSNGASFSSGGTPERALLFRPKPLAALMLQGFAPHCQRAITRYNSLHPNGVF